MEKISLLHPTGHGDDYTQLSEVAVHDLGFDAICEQLSDKEPEKRMILRIMSRMTPDPYVAKYRGDIFDDIMKYPDMRNRMLEILNEVKFLKEFGSFKRDYDETAGAWDIIHRLDEINDYIKSVEAIQSCLDGVELSAQGLLDLREYVQQIYTDSGFEELKKDISNLKATTDSLKSVTVGINLNDRFEAESIGLVSINDKPYTRSNIVGNFCDMLISRAAQKKGINEDQPAENKSLHYQPFTASESQILEAGAKMGVMSAAMKNPLMIGLAGVPEGDTTQDITRYMDKVTNHMISTIVKRLRDTLSKYVTITITDITGLIPEFIYYIRWAEYIEKMQAQGLKFSRAVVYGKYGGMSENAELPDDAKRDTNKEKTASSNPVITTHAQGIYNMKLIPVVTEKHETIVTNDLDFNVEHCVYILTGANRGGKTTITQAIGQLFVMAQGGIYVPGESFEYTPVDCIYTHFPANEDKTLDLGRLGEECRRFRDIYIAATEKSLLLLNETFSTTSFEEGYFIAKDSVRAILRKGIRTIYNTHMHKLGYEVDKINATETDICVRAASLIVRSDAGKRSFKVQLAPPEGMSYAEDIARKYGVTYELLTENMSLRN